MKKSNFRLTNFKNENNQGPVSQRFVKATNS